MTKKIYYERKGRKYVPVAEYDSEYLDSFPKGNHLVMCYPGGSSRRFNIDPNYAAMIAAGRVAEEAICASMIKAAEIRPMVKDITPEQRAAFDRYLATIPEDNPGRNMLTYGSVRDHAEAGVRAMMEEAEKLLTNESVKKAFDHFILMCELTKESQND